MKLDPARSFLEAGEISLQPIPLELAASSPDRPAVTRASRASSQEFDGWLCAHIAAIQSV
ncbi:MAG TPA: hypothetical protein VF386_04170 [Usitatibacter sp.]